MLAAFAHALLAGHSPAAAARYGHAAARLTLESGHTVRPDLTPRLLEDAVAAGHRPDPEFEDGDGDGRGDLDGDGDEPGSAVESALRSRSEPRPAAGSAPISP